MMTSTETITTTTTSTNNTSPEALSHIPLVDVDESRELSHEQGPLQEQDSSEFSRNGACTYDMNTCLLLLSSFGSIALFLTSLILHLTYSNYFRISLTIVCIGLCGSIWSYSGFMLLGCCILLVVLFLISTCNPTDNCLKWVNFHVLMAIPCILLICVLSLGLIFDENGMVIQVDNNTMYRCSYQGNRIEAHVAFASLEGTTFSNDTGGPECSFWQGYDFCARPLRYLDWLFRSQQANGTQPGVYLCTLSTYEGIEQCFAYRRDLSMLKIASGTGLACVFLLLVSYAIAYKRETGSPCLPIDSCNPCCSPHQDYAPLKSHQESPSGQPQPRFMREL